MSTLLWTWWKLRLYLEIDFLSSWIVEGFLSHRNQRLSLYHFEENNMLLHSHRFFLLNLNVKLLKHLWAKEMNNNRDLNGGYSSEATKATPSSIIRFGLLKYSWKTNRKQKLSSLICGNEFHKMALRKRKKVLFTLEHLDRILHWPFSIWLRVLAHRIGAFWKTFDI